MQRLENHILVRVRPKEIMRVAVIDGQGGGIGNYIAEQLHKKVPELDISS